MRRKQIYRSAPGASTRLAELQAIATTGCEDNREAATHDIELEFPSQPLEQGDSQ